MRSTGKDANPKRASAPLKCDRAKQFDKDWERLSRAGRYDLRRAKEGMLLLIANDSPLPAEFLDHALTGGWSGHREFHAGGDLLVIYLRRADAVIFSRIGSHTELFD